MTLPAEREIEELARRIAPVQGYSAGIPWSMHLRAYDVYCKRYGPQKALIEGWCRGGFGVGELDMFIPGWRDELSEITRLNRQITALKAEVSRLENELHCANDLLADAQGEINQAEARGVERALHMATIVAVTVLGREHDVVTRLRALKQESTPNGMVSPFLKKLLEKEDMWDDELYEVLKPIPPQGVNMRRFNSKGEPHPGPDATLEELLEWARSYVMTPAEWRAQRISWVAGEMALAHPEHSLAYWKGKVSETYDQLYGKGYIAP